jgi:serine/threonine protein phosphatase 1
VAGRTFAIGDIHGDLPALDGLLERLPRLDREDTVVFLGDYVDRGPDARGVVARVRGFVAKSSAHVVTLRGNHEDKWIQSAEKPDLPFLLQWGNGCAATYRSFIGGPPLSLDDSLDIPEIKRMLEVSNWLPADVVNWFRTLPLYYEDEHAIYVHAGLERAGAGWKHPKDSSPKPLLWMRDAPFFNKYRGKRVVFGHTPVGDLPVDRERDAPTDEVWIERDLIGLDTACGRGGPLSAVELPSKRVYQAPGSAPRPHTPSE